jgi:hypothetical protein
MFKRRHSRLAVVAGSVWYNTCRLAALAIASTVLLPCSPHSQRVVDVLDLLIFHWWKRYVSFRVSYHPSIQPAAQYIWAEVPHGVRCTRFVALPALWR